MSLATASVVAPAGVGVVGFARRVAAGLVPLLGVASAPLLLLCAPTVATLLLLPGGALAAGLALAALVAVPAVPSALLASVARPLVAIPTVAVAATLAVLGGVVATVLGSLLALLVASLRLGVLSLCLLVLSPRPLVGVLWATVLVALLAGEAALLHAMATAVVLVGPSNGIGLLVAALEGVAGRRVVLALWPILAAAATALLLPSAPVSPVVPAPSSLIAVPLLGPLTALLLAAASPRLPISGIEPLLLGLSTARLVVSLFGIAGTILVTVTALVTLVTARLALLWTPLAGPSSLPVAAGVVAALATPPVTALVAPVPTAAGAGLADRVRHGFDEAGLLVPSLVAIVGVAPPLVVRSIAALLACPS